MQGLEDGAHSSAIAVPNLQGSFHSGSLDTCACTVDAATVMANACVACA